MLRYRTTTVVLVVLLTTVTTSALAATIDVVVGPGGAFVFTEADVTINLGDTVRWTWDSDGHNVGAGLPGDPLKIFLSGPPAPAGTVFSVTFDAGLITNSPVPDNIYHYHCHPHGDFGMIGSVTVLLPCPADCAPPGGNGVVNVDDLFAVINAISTQALDCDVAPDNGDGTFGNGVINFDDIIQVINDFGSCL